MKISISVRDVFNFLDNIENYDRVLYRAEEMFNLKYLEIEDVLDRFDILPKCIIKEKFDNDDFDYFDLIIWENQMPDEYFFHFFYEDIWDDGLPDMYILDFKKFFIQSLKLELNNYLKKLL